MRRVLVTGATGFIGNYVVEELLKHGLAVVASSANQEKAREASWFRKVTYICFDLKQLNHAIDYYQIFHRPDLIIHLAWEGLPNYKSYFHLEENLPRHTAFLANLVRNGLKDLTVTGTCLEYGMKEGRLSEEMTATPSTSYAVAKNELRKSLEALQLAHPFMLKWVRLFYMYGKGQHSNSLLSQLDKSLANKEETFNMSGGEQVRDYLPVEQVAEYIVKISLQDKITGIINCCSGRPVSIKQLVTYYLKKVNKNIALNFGYYPYTDYEPMHFWGDSTKLETILNNE